MRKRKQHKSIDIIETEQEVTQILGWCLFTPNKKENIFELRETAKLSKEEALLVKNVLEKYKAASIKVGEKNLRTVFENYCEQHNLKLRHQQEQYLHNLLDNLAHGFGPLEELLAQDHFEEISCIGIGYKKAVMVFDREKGWLKTNLCYTNKSIVKDTINKMARRVGRRLSLKTPKINAVLPSGFRLQASMKPVAFSGINFTIRRFRDKAFTPNELVTLNIMSPRMLAFLKLALQSEASLVVVGNTGSGKTTTLNTLFSFIGEHERIVLLEETPELSINKEHVIRLLVSEEQDIDLNDLITETLRMRPDRVVVGEVRKSLELKAFFNTLQAGQGRGSSFPIRAY